MNSLPSYLEQPALEYRYQKIVKNSKKQIILDVELHPKQHKFVHTDKYYAAMIGGIGSGKSIAGNVRGLNAAYGRIGDTQIETPNLGVITAPTYPMLRDATLRTFKEFAGDLIVDYNKTEGLATMSNGSEVLFRSANEPERLRGPSISWWFGDEAAMYPQLVWSIMVGRLRQFGKRGYGWLGTTPRGRNWLWQVFVRDMTDDMFMTQVTSKENYFQDSEIVKGWEQLYVGDFARQELEGEFVAFTGLIYPEFSRLKHITSEIPNNIVYSVAGVDWGFANPGVIMVAGVDGDGRMTLLEEAYAPGRRIGEWAEVGAQLRERWNIKTFYCDPSEPDYIRAFEEAGLNAVPANNSVNTGIQAVKARLAGHEPRLMVYNAVVHYPDEAEQYIWATNQHGIKDAPVKAKDHTQDAVRYLVMGVDYSDEVVLSQRSSNWIGYNKGNDNGKRKRVGIRRDWDR